MSHYPDRTDQKHPVPIDATPEEIRRLVVNRRHSKFDVYIGRPSLWGNPFSENGKGEYHAATKQEAIAKYKKWLLAQPELVERAKRELRGKILGCWCSPGICHGEVLARIANEGPAPEVETAGLVAQINEAPYRPASSFTIGDYDPRALGARCDECPLQGKTVVPPTPASRRVKLVIIGEGPGRLEEWKKQPFIGPSGKLLDRMLEHARIDRRECHVTNATLCRPNDDLEDTKAAATACCAPRLARELSGQQVAQVPILALGSYATRVVIGARSIMLARGFVWKIPPVDEKKIQAAQKRVVKLAETLKDKAKLARLKGGREKAHLRWEKAKWALYMLEARKTFEGRVAIATLHPAFILRGADAWQPVLANDVRRMGRWLSEDGIELQDEVAYRTYKTVTGKHTVAAALRKLGPVVTLDVETDGPDPLHAKLECVGVSDGKKTLVIYPWKNECVPVLSDFLKTRTVVMHNGPQFDHMVLERRRIKIGKWEDTLLAHYAFASHLPKRLDHVVSVYTDSGPWKMLAGKRGGAEEKGLAPWEKGGDALTRYNAADVHLTKIAWDRMQADLDVDRHVYEHDKNVALMCKVMRVDGIRVDVARRTELSKKLRARKAALLGMMRSLVKKQGFSPARLDDVRDALFGKFNARAIRPTEKGAPSTNNETLETLRVLDTRAGRLADMLLRWRSAAKTVSTFVDGPTLDSNGRIHPGWGLGPVTGRLKCSPDNIMNLPRYGDDLESQVRALYIPAPGHVFVYFDLSQAEARGAAYISGDKALIAACEKDIHLANAMVVFQDMADAAQRLAHGNEVSTITDANGKPLKWKAILHSQGGCKEERDVAKNCGFAVWYNGSAERVFITLRALGFDVTLDACQLFVDKFHRAYPRYYEYVDENIAFCAEHGHLATALLGRKRWLGWHAPPTEIANFPIQSFIADLMNVRLVRIHRQLPKLRSRVVAQIHDAAIIEVPERYLDSVGGLIRETWAEPIVIPHNGLSFVMPIDLKTGDRWSNLG